MDLESGIITKDTQIAELNNINSELKKRVEYLKGREKYLIQEVEMQNEKIENLLEKQENQAKIINNLFVKLQKQQKLVYNLEVENRSLKIFSFASEKLYNLGVSFSEIDSIVVFIVDGAVIYRSGIFETHENLDPIISFWISGDPTVNFNGTDYSRIESSEVYLYCRNNEKNEQFLGYQVENKLVAFIHASANELLPKDIIEDILKEIYKKIKSEFENLEVPK